MCQSLIVLSCDESEDESDVESWSLEGKGFLSPFARMDDESLEDDLDYFMALDLAVAESSPRVALVELQGKKRIGVSKRSVGMLGESLQRTGVPQRCRRMGMERSHPRDRIWLEEGTRRIILAPTIGPCFKEGDLRALFDGE